MEKDNAVSPSPAAEIPTEAAPVLTPTEDAEARIAALEQEKAKLIEEGANWKVAALKYKSKAKDEGLDDEDEDEKVRRIVDERLANSRLAEIAREQDAIIQKALKENKELKLAHLNKTTPPATMGTHSEGTPVKDTLVTADQITAFKSRGWSDKDIERYKKNLLKYGTR